MMRAHQLPALVAICIGALIASSMATAQDSSQVTPATAEPPPASSSVEPEPSEPLSTAAPVAGGRQNVEGPTFPSRAVADPVETVERGVGGLAAQSSRIWGQVLIPMWQRMAAALPILIKAVLLLLFFWLVAALLGTAVRKLLQLTRLDDRAVEDWGLAGILEKEGDERRSLAALAGRVTFWFIMLFGLLAFFQTLDLNMVAEPLQNVANGIVGIVPNVLEALVILFVYWVVATLIRLGLTKFLAAVSFDRHAGRYLGTREINGGTIAPSAVLGRLAFYVILLLGLPPFLEALGQTALVTPLTVMLGKALAFLPNIVAALVLFFLGKLVATVVREIVTNFLAAAGADKGAERLQASAALGSRKISDIAGAIAYFFILISVFVAAIDSLGITAISRPVSATLERLLTATPLLLVALVVLAIGWVVARAVRDVVASFLEGVGFDQYPERFGLSFLAREKGRTTLSSIVATAVMAIILVLTFEQVLATLGLTELGNLVGALVAYLPQLLTGVAILLAAIALGGLVGRLAREALAGTPYGRMAAATARYAIVFLGVSMALSQLGVGEDVVLVVVSAVLFGSALALGLAFGLGGRNKAKELIEQIDA